MELFHTGSISENRFLVTGGAGFIGSHIVAYLLAHGAGKVVVLDNLSTGLKQNLDMFSTYPNFQFLQGDITNAETCKCALNGIDYVSHQAALGSVPRSVRNPVATNESNVGGFVNIITAAKDAGVKCFVYASSSSVYGDESNLPKIEYRTGNLLSPYAVTKKTNELYAEVFHKLYGMKAIGLRYFNVFGPRQDPDGPYAAVIPLFVDGILNGKPVYINGDGEQTRDFTYIQNAVQANIKALFADNPDAFGQAYNIAVGENFSVNFLYRSIRSILQRDHQPTYRSPREGDIRDSLADITKAKQLLGYDPTCKFMEGLERTVEYFRPRAVF